MNKEQTYTLTANSLRLIVGQCQIQALKENGEIGDEIMPRILGIAADLNGAALSNSEQEAQGMRWVKASERLPGKKSIGTIVFKHKGNKHVGVYSKHDGYSIFFSRLSQKNYTDLEHIEWLDESAALSAASLKGEEWVRVEDGLPDEGEDVLIMMGKLGDIKRASGTYIGFLENGKWRIYSERGLEKDANDNPDMWWVTHWRNLPPPPKPQS